MRSAAPELLFAHHAGFDNEWPYAGARLRAGLAGLGTLRMVRVERETPLCAAVDLTDCGAVALFGGVLTARCIAAAPRLVAVACNSDNAGAGLAMEQLWGRGIPVIDTTAAWAPSVAECAIGLAIGLLRHIPHWHASVAASAPWPDFPLAQYCDDPGFAGGELGCRRVGVIALGQIGGRIARYCAALGSDVAAYDPHVSDDRFALTGARRLDLEALVDHSEVVFVAVPPTPSARGLLSARLIGRLRRGSLVVVVTRAHGVDMEALRRRIVAGELGGAFDVYDGEPLPPGDPLRGRRNVVHTPHIAGRTRDANLRMADMVVEGFRRIFAGERPEAILTREAVAVRTGRD